MGSSTVRRRSAGIRLPTWRPDVEVESKEAALLRSLEEQLLQPKIRKNPERLGDLLADEFIEFGSSGRTFDKRSVIDRLPQEQRHPEAQSTQWTITEFSARRLAPRVVLVTYRTLDPARWLRRRDLFATKLDLAIDRQQMADDIPSGHASIASIVTTKLTQYRHTGSPPKTAWTSSFRHHQSPGFGAPACSGQSRDGPPGFAVTTGCRHRPG